MIQVGTARRLNLETAFRLECLTKCIQCFTYAIVHGKVIGAARSVKRTGTKPPLRLFEVDEHIHSIEYTGALSSVTGLFWGASTEYINSSSSTFI